MGIIRKIGRRFSIWSKAGDAYYLHFCLYIFCSNWVMAKVKSEPYGMH